jgi:hypothetical protein
MRQPALRVLVLLFMALLATTAAPRAFADARSDAKAHYQAGMKAYNAADYRTAIQEFSSAQQIAPADLMNYNIALCYDKLGEAEPAIQFYKAYLAKVPSASNRSEIEASVSRLEAALKSAAQKRADEQRAADEARKAEEARKANEAMKADEARRAEEARRAAVEAARKKAPDTSVGNTGTDPSSQVPTGVGSTGTPGTAQAVSTGDAQLDRAAAINIDEIRTQRQGMGTGGATGAQGMGGQNMGQPGVGGQPAVGAQANAGAPQGNSGAPDPAPSDQPAPKKPTPVYKKWWFWVVVGISAIVVYQIATEGSNSNGNVRGREVLPPSSPRTAPDGVTLFHF